MIVIDRQTDTVQEELRQRKTMKQTECCTLRAACHARVQKDGSEDAKAHVNNELDCEEARMVG